MAGLRRLLVAMVGALSVGLMGAFQPTIASAAPRHDAVGHRSSARPRIAKVHPVTGRPLPKAHPAKPDRAARVDRLGDHYRLPKATSASVSLSSAWVPVGASGVSVRAHGHPAATPGAAGAAGAAGLATVAVRRPALLGKRGLAVQVADGAGGAMSAQVRVGYSAFADEFGGSWSSRLAVTAHPACWLTTPDAAGCSTGTPVAASNDTSTQTLSFTTTADAGTSAGTSVAATPMVFAVAAAASGTAANYQATPLSAAESWQVGTGSGTFTYSYPFALPAGIGGAGAGGSSSDATAPSLALSYSSGVVDGMSFDTNSQADPAGLGWTLTPGEITRTFMSCSDDDPSLGIGDECWHTDASGLVDEFSIVLNGVASPLTRVAGSAHGTDNGIDEYRIQQDPGWRLDHYTGQAATDAGFSNADNDNEGWIVSTPDGTKYWFGRGAGTKSTLTMPVIGNDPGEPCYTANGDGSLDLTASRCQQAYAWYLDKVTDAVGNQAVYYYDQEHNYYASLNDVADPVQYDSAGVLDHIDYSYVADGSAPGAARTSTARAEVDITHAGRCASLLETPSTPCAGDPTTEPDNWPDVPTDQICQAGEQCLNGSPSFFSINRYDTVTTTTFSGANATPHPVDKWTLHYGMNDADGAGSNGGPGDAVLWLSSITHAGRDTDAGGDAVTVPTDVRFGSIALQNRVDPTKGGWTATFDRVKTVTNETGGVLTVQYGHADGRECTPSYVNDANGDGTADDPLKEWASTKECFPVKWVPPGSTDGGSWEWFDKYVVLSTTRTDQALNLSAGQDPATAPGQVQVTTYDYQGAPAWRYQNSRNTTAAEETWNDWRGYETTIIHTRKTTDGSVATGDVSSQKVTVFRGMNGARKNNTADPNGGYQDVSASLTTTEHTGSGDATGEPVDSRWLAGQVAETTTYDGDATNGGTWLTRVYTDYSSYDTASDPTIADGHYVYPHVTKTYTRTVAPDGTAGQRLDTVTNTVADGGTNHRGVSLGEVTQVEEHDSGDSANGGGATSTAARTRCTTTTWDNQNDGSYTDASPGVWLRLPAASELHGAACGDAANGNLLRHSETYYDDNTALGGDLTHGLPTKTVTWTTADGSNPIITAAAYDAYGRVTSATDGRGKTTTTAYNPTGSSGAGDANDLPTAVKVTDPLGHTTSTALDPGRGLTLSAMDANGNTTSYAYDGLGRRTTETDPGTDDGATITHAYTISASSPSLVHTTTRIDASTTSQTWAYVDGWGRSIETQTQTPTGSGRIVTATGYDDAGRVAFTDGPDENSADPGSGLLNAGPDASAFNTVTTYDGAGRPLTVTQRRQTTAWSTVTNGYAGDRSWSINPIGGQTTTWTDAWGDTTEVADSLDAPGQGLSSAANTADVADYTTDAAGQLLGITEHTGSPSDSGAGTGTSSWVYSYGYDLAGRQISATDPDTGHTTTAYDADGNVTGVTGPTSHVTTAYDDDDRPTSKTDAAASETLEEWAYDTATPNGIGQLATAVSHTPLGEFTTTYGGYDKRGNLTSLGYTYPSGWTGEPDSTSSVTQTASYNDANQPVDITYPKLPGLDAMTTHTDYNRLDAPTAITGTNLITINSTATSATTSTLASYGYDSIGRRTDLSSTSNVTSAPAAALDRDYGYDPTGRLGTITASDATTGGTASGVQYLQLGYTYDAASNPLRIDATTKTPKTPGLLDPNPGFATNTGAWCYTYNTQAQLTTARTGVDATSGNTASGCQDRTLGLLDSLLAQVTNLVTGDDYDLAFTYTAGELTGVSGTTESLLGTSTSTRSYTYTNGTHQTTGITGTDTLPVGGLTTIAGIADGSSNTVPTRADLTYDTAGRVSVMSPQANNTLLGLTLTLPDTSLTTAYDYTYDPEGRVSTVTPTGVLTGVLGDVASETYAYDSADQGGNRVAVKTQTGLTGSGTGYTVTLPGIPGGPVAIMEVDSGTGILQAVTGGDRSLRALATPDGTPIGAQLGAVAGAAVVADRTANTGPGDFDWQVADAQDSIRFTDSTSAGSVQYSWSSYYPFGQGAVPVTATLTGGTSLGTGTGANDLLANADALPGGRTYLDKQIQPDRSLGLDHRTYQTNLDILTTPDPILVTTDPLGINPYAYTHNNPTGTSDPTGLMHNPDQPAPACGSTTQNCGANGDGSSNGYSQTPPPAAPWLPGWFEASLTSDHGSGARRDAIAEYIRDTAPTGTPQEVADRQQIYDYYCATYHAENCSPSAMQVASGLAGAATVLTGGFELEGGLEAAGTGITRILGKGAADAGTRLEIQIGTKIEGQMAKRGWTQESVEDLIANPSRTVPTRDTRHLPNGAGRNDAPATAYINRSGGYVVRNDETGDIVQVSDLNNPDWKSPW
jgi:RHS repeat-associated protein